ncbi:ester cyclase [Bradyrhizobium sp. CB82]|uniref:ester cyclase n=1 Tax=Bradyrhizobium sp. CB82 TaxID=3039159 RepID=UPI0024B1A77F|nr:ester cyclase [Bradyrhizobium sp. CB82]WFU42581.1 ester cyclase [Bradyrhizobium sp. CB82]
MSAEDNKALVRRLFEEVCNERKLGVADELFATNHTHHDPSNPSVGQGPEGMKQLISTYQTGFPDAHWSIDAMLLAEDGETVVARWTGVGTHTSDLPGIRATGKKVRVPGIWIYRFSSGKIVESWNIWDTLGMLQQLGIAPAMG